MAHSGSDRPAVAPLARRPVLAAMAALAVVLSMTSPAYGYHRDELYFRLLPPAWGYLDQPPLTPLLVRAMSAVLADEPWAIRIPATLCATASVLVVVLITRELGGGRSAQVLCAWSYAFAAFPLAYGHLMLTSSLDLVVWAVGGLAGHPRAASRGTALVAGGRGGGGAEHLQQVGRWAAGSRPRTLQRYGSRGGRCWP